MVQPLENPVHRDRAAAPRRSEIAFDDGHTRVVYRRAQSQYLLMTFNELGMRPDGMQYWASSLVETLDIACLGVVSHRPDWFPTAQMKQVAEATAAIRSQFSEVILYGTSMGGFAAIKHSGRFGAAAAIAYCPQFSIAPQDVGTFDGRYTPNYTAGRDDDMRIRANDVAGAVWTFHDPTKRDDSRHIALIRDAIGAEHPVRSIFVPFVGHDVAQALAGHAVFSDLLAAIRADDRHGAQRIARRRAKTYAPRLLMLAGALERRKSFAAAASVGEQALQSAPGNLACRLVVSRSYLAVGNLEAGLSHAVEACRLHPKVWFAHQALSAAHMRQGQWADALAAIDRALDLHENSPSCRGQRNAILAGMARQAASHR